MPRTIGRNLNLCFTKIKQQPQQHHSRPLPPISTTSAILIKNFNTLYDPTTFDSPSNSNSISSAEHLSSSSDSDSDTAPAPPDFATVFASQRFFFSSPGRSNSIVESSASSPSSSSLKSPESELIVGGGIPIPTFSPDPYADFRRSMQEMVESRDHLVDDVRSNGDYLHELLTCYLALNPKSTHKFIMGAFADLLISLMPAPADGGPRDSGYSEGGRKILRRC